MTWLRLDEPSVLFALLALAPFVLMARAGGGETRPDPLVDGNFPGGNIVLERIEGDDVYIRQDLRDTEGHWFWWHFRVRGAEGRTLTFHFTNGNVLGVRGPAVSADGGATWAWLGRKPVKGASFRYPFAADAGEVRFCFAMPYFEADLRRFLKPRAANPHLAVETLCTTRKGRACERLRLGKLDGAPDHRALITCRHHCCECMASYAVEGMIEATLGETEDGAWLRDHVEFLLVPFVDKDGVEDGDQGKNRKPHDHNRDYAGESRYPAVRALRQFVATWSQGRLHLAFDLHCPHIRGQHNEVIYMVGSHDPGLWEQQQRFGKILEATQTGPLVYRTKDNLPFGKAWNTSGNYGPHKSCSRWAGELPGIRLASSFELPYANAAGRPVTAESARAFGHDLARAIRRYLQEPPTAQ